MKYINCGCGNRFSTEKEWINIDFNSMNQNIRSINILKGLPFSDNSIDAIFSSCMLEHFTKEQALKHLKECYRILKMGGVCRVVVPDLEDVCKEYLRILESVKKNRDYQAKYDYIMIELIDQMTRMYSGGEMQKYWDSENKDEEYILERTGYPEAAKGKMPFSTFMRLGVNFVAKKILGWIPWYQKFQLGSFMMSGETHKWMYDEYGLFCLMEQAGFGDIKRKKADDSSISNWSSYSLEMDGEREYKPHSLYIEGVKN